MRRYLFLLKKTLVSALVFYAILRYSGGDIKTIRIMHLFIIVPVYNLLNMRKCEKKEAFLSALLSLFLTIGFSMRENNAVLDQPISQYIEMLCFWYGMKVFIEVIISSLNDYIKKTNITEDNPCISRKKYTAILLLCWLPYFLLIFPGGIWYDVGGELEQFYGATQFNNINPFLQTMLIGSFTYLGQKIGYVSLGIGLYNVVQALYAAVIISDFVATIAELLHLNRTVAKRCLLLYGLIPAYPLFVFAVGKDLNWSVSILFCITNIIKIFHDTEQFFGSVWSCFKFVSSLLLVVLLRNSGLPIAILLAAISLTNVIQKKKTVMHTVCLGVFVALFLTWSNVLLPMMNVSTVGNAKEYYSVPLLQMGRAMKYYPEDFTEEDEYAIGRVVDLEAMKHNYKANDSDSIKETFNNFASDEELNMFMNVYQKEFRKRPLCYIDSMIAKSYAYFDPDAKGSAKPFAVAGNYAASRLEPLGINVKYLSERMTYIVAGLVERSRQVPLYNVLTKCGIWVWTYLYCFYYSVKHIPKKYSALFLPGIAIIIGLIFTPINGYFRYTLPIVMMVPAAIMVRLKPKDSQNHGV